MTKFRENILSKFEPIDLMILITLFFLMILIVVGKNGVVIGMMNTLIGALVRGFVKGK